MEKKRKREVRWRNGGGMSEEARRRSQCLDVMKDGWRLEIGQDLFSMVCVYRERSEDGGSLSLSLSAVVCNLT